MIRPAEMVFTIKGKTKDFYVVQYCKRDLKIPRREVLNDANFQVGEKVLLKIDGWWWMDNNKD